jgi:LysM repeat protein
MARKRSVRTRRIAAARAAAALVALLVVLPAHADGEHAPDLSVAPAAGAEAEPSSTLAPGEGAQRDAPGTSAPAPRARKRPARRGGVNPCMTPDPGFGIYDSWSRKITMGQLLAPQRGGVTRNGGFDLIVHFHGHYPIRKEFVKVADGVVLVAIDLGIGSGAYGQAFSAPFVFEKLIDSVKAEMARRTGKKKTYVRKLALSAWSAGYGAIEQILRQPAGKKVDTVILLDSLHAGYVNQHADDLGKRLKTAQIDPFVDFARKAVRGQKLLFQSHSSIPPPGYASTAEVSQYMVEKLGGKLRKARRSDVLGLEMFERYDRRGYHVRGYRGNDKPDHCAHLGLFKDVLKVHIKPRWRSPRGRRGKIAVAKAKVEAKKSGNVHVVQKGESLGRIAKRHGTSVRALRDANGLAKNGRKIQPGDELVIPAGGKTAQRHSGNGKPALRPGERIHTVVKGDALIPIAKKYDVTLEAIRERNGLRRGGRQIQPGDDLVIPRKH